MNSRTCNASSRPRQRWTQLIPLLSLTLLSAVAHAAKVKVTIEGLEGPLKDAAEANVTLSEYKDRDVSPAEARRLFESGDKEVRKAVEPFGYYQAQVESQLRNPDPDTFEGVYKVKLGDPVVVRESHVEVRGTANELDVVKEALKAFAPKVGDRLDHGQYEANKALIDSRLKTAGYLDAKMTQRRIEVSRANNSASIDLVWDAGERYRFGPVRFPDVQISPKVLPKYIPWREGAYYSTDLLLTMQQRLVDADYFSAVSVQPALEEAKNGVVPIEVVLVPAKQTVYSAEAFVSTDTGPGVRLGIERRWVNDRGHKLGGEIEYSQRLEQYGLHYRIPKPGKQNSMYTFATGYRDEETDTSRSRTARVAATLTTERWHGYTRSLGLQFLKGDFEIADEQHNSTLLFADGMLTQKRADDLLFPRKGYSVLYGLRFAPKSPLTDTTFAQVRAEGKWIRAVSKKGRVLLRAAGGAMAVRNFDDLPPELRFFAGGDRSVRGFDYQAIGEVNGSGGVIGGEYLAVGSAEYEHYFVPNWGAGVFVDAGDAFKSSFDANVGTGIGLRWRSPVGLVRLDVARAVVSDLKQEYRVHLVIGPDL
ncbi:MAG TPA: autotransporter assembly complex family protein [Steroidobacteraceae bacterium]|nr:autotransporter assembly complex family protein [Steroidobacteraceae bacterium]